MARMMEMPRRQLDEHDRYHPPLPGHRVHTCTDLPCLCIFGVAIVGLLLVYFNALATGDRRKLVNGFNYRHRMCGVDEPDKPYVFWCKDFLGQDLQRDFPMCRKSCPTYETANSTKHWCYDRDIKQTMKVTDYPTVEVFGFCLPQDTRLAEQAVGHTSAGHGLVGLFIRSIRVVWQAKVPLLISIAFSVLLGYLYLASLERFAMPMLYFCLVMLQIAPIIGAVYFFLLAHKKGNERPGDEEAGNYFGTWSAKTDAAAGFILLVIAAVIGIVICCIFRNVERGTKVVKLACECMFEVPSLLLEPMVSLAIKVVIGVVLLFGFVTLLSTATITPMGEEGIYRWFVFSDEQWIFIVYWILMAIWLNETTHALSQYVLAWITEYWYFAEYDSEDRSHKEGLGLGVLCEAYANGVFYHLGTLALAAPIILIARVPRAMLSVIDVAADRNRLGQLVCGCILRCYRNFFEPFDKTLYMDVALKSCDLCVAARPVLIEAPTVTASLNGMQLVFQVAGIGIITVASFFLCLLMCTKLAVFHEEDSHLFVSNPAAVAVAAAIFSFLVAMSFMVVFDTVGDTILYCYGVEEARRAYVEHEVYGNAFRDIGARAQSTFGWLFGGEEDHHRRDAHEWEERRMKHAPHRLRSLLDELSGGDRYTDDYEHGRNPFHRDLAYAH